MLQVFVSQSVRGGQEQATRMEKVNTFKNLNIRNVRPSIYAQSGLGWGDLT